MSPREHREYVLDLDSGPSDSWTGDVDSFRETTTSIRGAGSARLEPGYSSVRRSLEKTKSDQYAIWWMVAPNTELHVGFESDSTVGFGFAARPGQGGGVTVNPPKEDQKGGVSLYGRPKTGQWYRIVFSNVDFETEEFDVALRDAGDVELIRAQSSFANPVTDISAISIRNMVPDGRGRVWVDKITITTGAKP